MLDQPDKLWPVVLRAFKGKRINDAANKQMSVCVHRNMSTGRRDMFDTLMKLLDSLYEGYVASGLVDEEGLGLLVERLGRVKGDEVNSVMFAPDLDDAFVVLLEPVIRQKLGLGVYLTQAYPDRPDVIWRLVRVGGPEAEMVMAEKAALRDAG